METTESESRRLVCPYTRKAFVSDVEPAYLGLIRWWVATPQPELVPNEVRLFALMFTDALARAESGETMYQMGGFVELASGQMARGQPLLMGGGDEGE